MLEEQPMEEPAAPIGAPDTLTEENVPPVQHFSAQHQQPPTGIHMPVSQNDMSRYELMAQTGLVPTDFSSVLWPQVGEWLLWYALGQ